MAKVSLWSKYLKGWVFRSQLNGDPNQNNDCGPADVAMCLEYQDGKYRDPYQVLSGVVGDGWYGDTDWDRFMFPVFQRRGIRINYANADGSGAAQGTAISSEGAMRSFLWGALQRGHPTIMLVWLWIDGVAYGHFETCVGSWYKLRKRTRYYQMADSWTGTMVTVTAAQLWQMSQRQMMEVFVLRKKGLPTA